MDKEDRGKIAHCYGEKIGRNLAAIDETVVKAVYSAVDIERNKLMRVLYEAGYNKVFHQRSSKILQEQA